MQPADGAKPAGAAANAADAKPGRIDLNDKLKRAEQKRREEEERRKAELEQRAKAKEERAKKVVANKLNLAAAAAAPKTTGAPDAKAAKVSVHKWLGNRYLPECG